MIAWVERLLAVGWIAHWWRAIDRFNSRLGGQFAAAITYFSVLSMVPIAMVAFAAVGLTITTFVPDVLEQIQTEIEELFEGQGGALGEELVKVVDQAFASWQTVGIIGLLIACWTGANWVGNLRSAIRAQMRPRFDVSKPPKNPVIQLLQDLLLLLMLLVLVTIPIALLSAATSARDWILSLLGLDRVAGGDLLLSVVPLAVSLLTALVLFLVLFRVFPEARIPTRILLQGAVMGSVGMVVLQYATGLLITLFSRTPTSAVFGNVIAVMLFLNLLSTLILILAAWMASADWKQPVIVTASDLPREPSHYATKQLLAELERADAEPVAPPATPGRVVRERIATGALLGAVVAWGLTVLAGALARLVRR